MKKEAPKPATPAEMIQRRQYVTRLILSGLTVDQIVRNAASQGLTPEAVRRAYEGIVGGWRRDQETSDAAARAEAIQRLRRDLADMRNPGQLRNKNGYPVFENVLDDAGRPVKAKGRNLKRPVQAPIDWARVNAHEALLAKIEGTLKPIEVKVEADVTLRRSLLAVVASLTPEQMDRYAEEDLELERKAKQLAG